MVLTDELLTIDEWISFIKNPSLKINVREYINSLQPEFNESPASRNIHHAYPGGLWRHTSEVVEIGLNIIKTLNKPVNQDYYIAAAILHDAGKVGSYIEQNGKFQHVVNGIEIEHSLRSIMDWLEAGKPMPREIQIAILSHMGGWSKTGVYPDNLLGSILHSADLISSRLEINE